jgi:5-methyltetrahydrofolate--homocysteine methyltransferase
MSELVALLQERVLVLDGAIGTITTCDPCVDFLCLTDPDQVRSIHARYLAAGADIIETNTFNSNSISLSDLGHPDLAPELNLAAAKLAREVAASFSSPSKPRFVAGSIGPTSISLSRPSCAVSFDGLTAAYAEQLASLAAGGVDLFLIETVVDSLNAKAALAAAASSQVHSGRRL